MKCDYCNRNWNKTKLGVARCNCGAIRITPPISQKRLEVIEAIAAEEAILTASPSLGARL